MIARFDSLASRTILLLLIGIGLVHAASLYAYQHALEREASLANEVRLADRLLTIRRSVMRLLPAEREPVAHELSGGPIEAHWSPTDKAVPGGPGVQEWQGLRAQLQELGPDLAPDDIIIGSNRKSGDDPHLALISLHIPDGSWVNVTLFGALPRPQAGHGTMLSTSLMALGVVLVSILVVGWMTKPLRHFADVAQRIYRTSGQVHVEEKGPREVRELASAFNEMQARIQHLIDGRTQALAAVSHYLKTPLTRLRLRAEGVGDPALAGTIVADIHEMERMIDQTLAHLRGDRSDEEVRSINLMSILQTLVDDATDSGATVTLAGPASLVLPGRPMALKRALSNLIDNAEKYGGSAHVRVAEDSSDIVIHIKDDGPGIPEARMESVFAPFVRVETSRNKETGGFGLGLSIAQAAILGHGGKITLANRTEGGLLVTISLPKITPEPV
jgi:two-component system, OmpR family, sensor kinase